MDQFGQKSVLEGNYNIKIRAEAGQGEVKKSDIFKVKHKDVLSIKSRDANLVNEISGKNLKPGAIHSLKVGEITSGAIAPATMAAKTATNGALNGLFVVDGGGATDGVTYGVAVTVKERTYADGAQCSVTLEVKGFKIGADGTRTSIEKTVTISSKDDGDPAVADVAVDGITGAIGDVAGGDGKQTKVTLCANDTLGDVALRINRAIGDGLGQGAYVKDEGAGKHFAVFVEKDGAAGPETVAGTFVIRSLIPGSTGRLNFAGDEDVIKALSLNVIQDARESDYTVDVTDAHTGKKITEEPVKNPVWPYGTVRPDSSSTRRT